jgi:hypothetical protein
MLCGCSGDARAPDDASEETAAATHPAASSVSPPAPVPSPRRTSVALDGEGLRFVADSGKTTLLAFGTPRAPVERAVRPLLGGREPKTSANDECGAGRMEFADFGGLSLNYSDGKFVGWFARDGAPSTMNGIAAGMSQAALKASGSQVVMVPDSTLDGEFSLGREEGAIGGFVEGKGAEAKVTGLYAGVNCFFR